MPVDLGDRPLGFFYPRLFTVGWGIETAPAAPEPFMTDQIHLMVATPCFGGQVSSIYAGSIFHLQRAARSMPNLDLTVLMRDGDALITRARANLVTLFLDDPTATHFLFVDADIGFTPEQVFRLIESGADVVAGVYPIKRVNWDKAKPALQSNRTEVASAGL